MDPHADIVSHLGFDVQYILYTNISECIPSVFKYVLKEGEINTCQQMVKNKETASLDIQGSVL